MCIRDRVVKGVPGNLHGVGFVCLNSAQRISAVLPDQQRIDRTDVKSRLVKDLRHRFVVSASMLHDDPGLALNGFQLPYQGRKSLRTVNYVKGQPYNLAKGTEYRYGAFSAGNINARCV